MFKHDLGNGADLRILEARHAGAFLALVEGNRDQLGEWLTWARTMTTPDEARAFIKRGLTRYLEDGLPWVGIWQDEAFAGGILFFPIDARVRSTEVGFWLGEAYVGRGLMTRALLAMMGYVFDTLALNRLALCAEVGNQRSRAVAERLGFTLEGIHLQDWVNGERLVDTAHYAMLASGWGARRQP
jgi:ribosomal-protein-serine acetyltransferase